MPSLKRTAGDMKYIAATAAAQPEEIRTRRTAAEQTYQGLVNRLGAPGTYDTPSAAGTQQTAAGNLSSLTGATSAGGDQAESPQDLSIFKTEKAKTAAARDIDPRFSSPDMIQDITSLDPSKTIKSIEGSSQFRTMSRLQAESEQLIAREGPLYDEMQKNLQNPIIAGSAAIARENAAELKRQMAKGGSARRGAFAAVQQMRQQEQINQQRITALNQSNFALDQWARTNARTNLEFGQNWASNVGGVRESFNQAMDNAAELMTTQALPLMMMAKEKASAYRQAAHAQSQSTLVRWAKGIVGAVMMYASKGQYGGSLVEGAIQPGGANPSAAGQTGGSDIYGGLSAIGGKIFGPSQSATPNSTSKMSTPSGGSSNWTIRR